MKTETWIMAVCIGLLLLLTAALAHHTAIANLQAEHRIELAAAQSQKDAAMAAAYWMRINRLPRPHSPPLEVAVISSGTGYRVDPMGGTNESLHQGTDLVAPIGTPVKAVQDGVIKEHWVPPDGRRWKGHPIMGGLLVIDHIGFFAKYGHLSKTFVHEGDHVKRGQIIGLVGNTGVSTGSHLHFEIVVNPLEYLETSK